jgi:hypothetical protein
MAGTECRPSHGQQKVRQPLARRTLAVVLAATWFTAIATGVLAIFAVVTAWYACKAFREQSAVE